MTETTALARHSCAACGAKAEWHPSRQALLCSYCGTEAPGELDLQTGQVREIDLVQALRSLPEEQRGWQMERRSVRCRSCEAVTVFDPQRVGQNCDFCGSPELVDYDEIKAPIRPEGVLPFKVSEPKVRESLRAWYAGKWLAPGKLKRKALLDTIRGLYLPYWTFDARVFCRWAADSGTYYYTTQTVRDRNGRTRTRQVRHVRWRPASGSLSHAFDDEAVPGTRGVDPELLRKIEPFPTRAVVPYDTGFLSGFVIEHYQVVLIEAARLAREAMDRRLKQLCGAEVPGDTYRNLRIEPNYSDRTFKHVLVPVWWLKYDYRSKAYRIAVNGSTGEIAGEYPKSFWKIALLVLLGVAAAVTIALIAR